MGKKKNTVIFLIMIILVMTVLFFVSKTPYKMEFNEYASGNFGADTYYDGGKGELIIPANVAWEIRIDASNVKGELICEVYDDTYEFGSDKEALPNQILNRITIKKDGNYNMIFPKNKEKRVFYYRSYVTQGSEAMTEESIGMTKTFGQMICHQISSFF